MATSGMPLFIDNVPVFLAYFGYCIFCFFYFKVNLRYFLPFLLLFCGILFVQFLNTGTYYTLTAVAQLMILMTAVITVDALKERFVSSFLQIMYYIAIISLVFFIPIFIQPGVADLLIAHFPIHVPIEKESYGIRQIIHSFLFFNFSPDFNFRIRNVGPFWEAGVYGGYLMVTLILNSIKERSIFNRKGILFIFCILTTFSTTAYLALFLFIGVYYAVKIGSPILRAVSILVFAGGFGYAYAELEFLGSKIEDEMKLVAYDAQVQGGNSRMASAYLDITELDENKLFIFFGRGNHPEHRVATRDKAVQRNNGTTDVIAVWGIPFFIIYVLLMGRSIRSLCVYYKEKTFVALLFVIIMLTLGVSEPYFRFGFFYALVLLYIPFEHASKRPDDSVTELQPVIT
ncbi:hypothetical protein [Flavihumibacter sp. CACIAM 22H1]|uniref:hypothetical protein n=1 Tax=Flavihumibacter sp. CACIAM 22H1 TaxID=1812911 RepID=UPI0025BA179E|nr:hypothetical protein [Flavihumibacter sp. CACIAM 22H1]